MKEWVKKVKGNIVNSLLMMLHGDKMIIRISGVITLPHCKV